MVRLGLFPVFAATIELILIQVNVGEGRGIGPIPSDVDSHDVLADKHPFIRSSSKERRDVNCDGRESYYQHPNRTHCCMLCHKGHYVAQHCESEDKTSICKPCREGSFNDRETSSDKCRGCQSCRSSLGQVTVAKCTSTRDTVCACSSNHYRTRDSPDTFCLPCSACHNGIILKACSNYSDTVCKCQNGFFLHPHKRNCSLCSSCEGEECKKECDALVGPVKLPPNSPDLTPILGSLVFVLTAVVLLLILKRLIKQPVQTKLISVFRICRPEQQSSPDEPQVQVTSTPQETNLGEQLLPTTAVPVPPNAQGLPDCVPPAGETQIPDRPELLYAVIENVPLPQWKEFVRRLGLTDNAIGRIQVEEWNVRDAQYKMLQHWRQQLGQRATVERMCSVLKEMELSGCSEAIQEMLSGQA